MIGFSTGVLFKTHETKHALGVIRALGCKCVELGLVEPSRIQSGWLDRVSAEDVAGFDYVSLHAPTIRYGNREESKAVLEKIAGFHATVRRLDLVVVHPNLIEDFSVLAATGLPIGLENMDWRKDSMKNPEEFRGIFAEHPDWKLVLDLNHVFTNDRTMSLAREFYRVFGNRIAHHHVSGFVSLHDPLFKTHQRQIPGAIEKPDVPVIDESGMAAGELEKELRYLTEVLGEHRD